jgi:outer membrane lipoprotein carrier protein
MNKLLNQWVVGLIFGFAFQAGHASGLDSLSQYFERTQTAESTFRQIVLDKEGRKTQEVTGKMRLQKPNKFRWDYDKPYVQQIVGDGQKIWIYDPELNQVTVRSFSKAANSTPAALIVGGKDIEKAFILKEGSRKDNLDWVIATPKVKDSGFERLYLGFLNDELKIMELIDSFGNQTRIEFNDLHRNTSISPELFKFIPPHDADVLRD